MAFVTFWQLIWQLIGPFKACNWAKTRGFNMTKSRMGRKRGSKERGYFYRKNRGWYALEHGRQIPLLDQHGFHIKDAKARGDDVQKAHARYLLKKQQLAEKISRTTVVDVCMAYLKYAKATGATKTHTDRSDTLFDFCFGLPARYRDKSNGENAQELTPQLRREMKQDRIHDGYGKRLVHELTWADIDTWIADHANWNGGVKNHIQAVKRAMNFAVERSLVEANPIRGYKVPRSKSRVTYITPEQEKACYEHCRYPLATAIRVCIRTGARFGCEFAKLTTDHIHDHGARMEWVFKADESKTRRKRVVRITDKEIIEIVRMRCS